MLMKEYPAMVTEITWNCKKVIINDKPGIHCSQTISVTVTETSAGILPHSSWANCSRCLRSEGCLLQTPCFSSFLRSSGCRSGIIEGTTEQSSVLPFFGVLAVWFFLIITLLEDPWPVTAFRHQAAHFSTECLSSLGISLYPALIQNTRCQMEKKSWGT